MKKRGWWLLTTAFHHHNFKMIPTGETRVRQEGGIEDCVQSAEWKGTVQCVLVCVCVCFRVEKTISHSVFKKRRNKEVVSFHLACRIT